MPVRSIVFVACAALCALAHLAIVVSVARRPAVSVEPGVPRPRRGLEIFWALLPMVVLALVLTATWDRMRDRPAGPAVLMKVAR